MGRRYHQDFWKKNVLNDLEPTDDIYSWRQKDRKEEERNRHRKTWIEKQTDKRDTEK